MVPNDFICELCGKHYRYRSLKNVVRYRKTTKYYICYDCIDTLPGKGSIVKKCSTCKTLYRSSGPTSSLCPDCLKKAKTRTCDICKEEFQVKTIDSRQKYHICPSCKASAVGEGKYLLLCVDCGKTFYGTTSRVLRCKECRDKYITLTCSVCGMEYKYEGNMKHIERYKTLISVCKSCYEKVKKKYNKPMHMICGSCGEYVGVASQFSLCPECNKPVLPKELICEICGDTYTNTHKMVLPRQRSICKNCRTSMRKSASVKEFESLIDSGWKLIKDGTILISPERASLSGDSVCKRCGHSYTKNTHNHMYCGMCKMVKTCEVCGYKFISVDSRVKSCSHSCSTIKRHADGFDSLGNIKMKPKRNQQVSNLSYNLDEWMVVDSLNIENFKCSGLWAKVSGNEVLDLMSTTNIYREYNRIQKWLEQKPNQKYEALSQIPNLEYRIITLCDYEDAMELEMKLAKEIQPRLWSPSPTQTKEWLSFAGLTNI